MQLIIKEKLFAMLNETNSADSLPLLPPVTPLVQRASTTQPKVRSSLWLLANTTFSPQPLVQTSLRVLKK